MKLVDCIAKFIKNYRINTSPVISTARYGVQPGNVIPFPAIPPKLRNKFIVRLSGNQIISQTVDSWEGTDILAPWEDFISWYENTDDPSFIFVGAKSAVMVRRQDVISFRVDIEEY